MKRGLIIILVFLLMLPIAYAFFENILDFFNYKLVQDKLEINLNSNLLNPNELLTITINPTYKGFYNVVYILDDKREIVDSIKLNCDNTCYNKEIINYYIPSNFNGIYTINVFDYSSLSYETTSFNVVPETSFQASAFEAEANNWDIGAYEFQSWQPPIGIPDPGFGIDEARPSRPNPWTSEQAGYYYIDYTTGTDSGRTYGYPAAPRKTIPNPVPAGSYVEVHGTYSYASGGVINLVGNGTGGSWVANKSGHAWIVGQDSANIPVFKNAKTVVKGQYVYFDMVRFEHTLQIGSAVAGYDADYIVVRNSTLVGDQSSARTGLSIIGSSASEEVTNVVIYNNLVYNWGDISSTFDQDASGIMPQEYTSNIWVLQNTVHTTSGTGIHSGGQSGSSPAITHHIYVGGNEVYNTRQSGIWLKNGMDVIFSQNHVHDIIDTSWSPSKGIGAQYGPQRLWIIFNRVHGARYGIRVPSTNAGTWYVYVIGNVIYNIKDGDGSYSGTSSWDEAAIHLHGATYAYVIGNTIYDSPSGIYGSATVPTYYYIENNIISDINEPNGSHIWIYDQTDNAVIRNSIISQYGGTETIKWGSSTKYTLSQFQSATGKGQGCSAADPLFVDKENYNLRIQSGSPARDTALPPPDLTSNVYATFNSLYGQNIEKDIDGVSRPQGLGWDMGAYEYVSEGTTTTSTTSTTTTSTATTIFQINLQQGWNLIGIPYAESNPRVESVFSEILNKLVTIYSYITPKKWEVYHNSQSIPYHLYTINDRQGYWVKVNQSATLINEGIINNTKLNYNLGWNLIAVEKEETLHSHLDADNRIEEAYNYSTNNNSYTYLPKDVILHKGRGYWILVNETI